MRIDCLGTVGYHPNRSRQTSAYLLPESGLLLDAGSGLFRLPERLETDSLDILLSHAHLDHTIGLTFLLDVFYQRPVGQLRIWAEAAKITAVREHLFDQLLFPAQLDAEWLAIDERPEFQIGDVQCSWLPQEHPGGSVAYRLTWPDGKRLIYATDTTGNTSDSYRSWSEDTDLLMHECYFRDDSAEWAQKTGHSWVARVIEVAQATRPKKLLLTHLNPLETSSDPVGIDQIRSQLDCEVILAEDELVVEF